MNTIFNDFEGLINKIQVLLSRAEFESLRANLYLHLNIIFSDLKRKNSLVVYISKTALKIYKGFSTSTGLSLIGHSAVWKKILKGEKSLGAAFTEGSVKVPNLRVNWTKLWKFSYILSILKNLN